MRHSHRKDEVHCTDFPQFFPLPISAWEAEEAIVIATRFLTLPYTDTHTRDQFHYQPLPTTTDCSGSKHNRDVMRSERLTTASVV